MNNIEQQTREGWEAYERGREIIAAKKEELMNIKNSAVTNQQSGEIKIISDAVERNAIPADPMLLAALVELSYIAFSELSDVLREMEPMKVKSRKVEPMPGKDLDPGRMVNTALELGKICPEPKVFTAWVALAKAAPKETREVLALLPTCYPKKLSVQSINNLNNK